MVGADALGSDGEFGADDPSGFPPYHPAQVVESFLDKDRALRVMASTYTIDGTDPSRGMIHVELRNTGLVDLTDRQFTITAAVTGVATFPGGAGVDVARQPPGNGDARERGRPDGGCSRNARRSSADMWSADALRRRNRL